jgi:hypothetical protein
MKPIKLIVVLALIVVPGLASAQGYYGGGPGYGPPPLPGGFHDRQGRLAIGGSLGLGYMNANSQAVTCQGCSSTPVTGEGDIHIGGFIGPRLALLFEGQVNVQQVALDPANDATLSQTLLLGAVQYWITPQLWIKGGIGLAYLNYNDNVAGTSTQSDGGLGLMGGLGYELLSARNFALDLQGRLTEGSYSTTDAAGNSQRDNITSGTIGVGLNWY